MIAIGVDAGGTSTTAIASIDGKMCEHVTLGPANVAVDFENAISTLCDAIEKVCEAVLRLRPLSATSAQDDKMTIVIGIAGAGNNESVLRIEERLQSHLCHPERRLPKATAVEGPSLPFAMSIKVFPDTHIALRAAVPEGDGIVLIAGTGSIAYAEIGSAIFSAGGHGHLFGDGGSGFAIGKAAVQLLAKVNDGRVPRDTFIDELSVAIPSIRELYTLPNPVPTIAKLAPIVLAAANRGDRSASRIVQGAAFELANLLKRLPIADKEIPLVLKGGLLQENSLFTYLLETRIVNEFPLLHVMKNTPPSHVGALRIAEKLHV